MTPLQARRLLDKIKPRFDIETFLFKEQLLFVREPARRATAVCSVRSGKSVSCAADLIDTALTYPNTIGLYITLVRSSAKRIIWPVLHQINRDFKLNAVMNETELYMKFSNGSVIYCSGANTEVEIEKFRGLSNVALAYIDESQAFREHIKELVEDILIKRLYDTNGRIRLIGTPGPIPAGYFYEMSQSSKWAHHAWTMHQNPYLLKKSGLTPAQLIQQDLDTKGVTIEDPAIQRECFGRWVLDSSSLLLNYDEKLNHYDNLPLGNYNYILGIDLGHDDADSLSVLAWSDKAPEVWLVEELVNEKQGVQELVDQVVDITKRYQFSKMRIDTGGLGKKIAEDIRLRKGIPVEPAEKQDKMSNYAFLNDALRRGHFKAKKTSKFANDCNILEKDRDKSTPDRVVVKGHSDAVDSVLYAFKDSPAYAWTPPPKQAKVGTPEWSAAEEERMREQLYAQIQHEREEMMNLDPWNSESQIDTNKWKRS